MSGGATVVVALHEGPTPKLEVDGGRVLLLLPCTFTYAEGFTVALERLLPDLIDAAAGFPTQVRRYQPAGVTA